MTNTDLKKLKELRHELLDKMGADFREELIPAVLAEEEEGQPETLSVIFDSLAKEGASADGEFLFMPTAEDDELQYFVSIINLAEEHAEETESELYAAMAVLNFYLTVGTFAVEPRTGRLIYKNAVSMKLPGDAEEMEEQMNRSMSTAVLMTDRFGGLLLDVIDGERTAADIVELFTPAEEG